MFHHQTWKDAGEELSYMKEEYDLLYKINEARCFGSEKKKCNHKKKVYVYHMPLNQFWMMVCDECGTFSPIACGCGGSGYMCNHHIETLAKEVAIVSVTNDKLSLFPLTMKEPENRYKEAVEKYGSICALDDEVVRKKETDVILNFFDSYMKPWTERVADVGCGDGYTLEKLSERYIKYDCDFFGFDIIRELLAAAKKRNLKNCVFLQRNATSFGVNDDFFDIIYTQRCIQNILSWEKQKEALDEIHRVLKPGGYYLMIEAFTDGLINNNRARMECGLPEIKEALFNRYLDKELFLEAVKDKFTVTRDASYNFLSSHYFISRVLHALITKGEQKKNTEFVKFFSYLPAIGEYSPIQTYILIKKGGTPSITSGSAVFCGGGTYDIIK